MPRTVMSRLMGGLILGGIGFIVFLLAFAALKAGPDWFLPGTLGVFAVGHLIAWFWRAKPVTLFAGKDGAAWLKGNHLRVIRYRDIQDIRELTANFRYKGIVTLHRELLVVGPHGKPKTWFVGAARENEAAEDPRYRFCGLVLEGFRRSK